MNVSPERSQRGGPEGAFGVGANRTDGWVQVDSASNLKVGVMGGNSKAWLGVSAAVVGVAVVSAYVLVMEPGHASAGMGGMAPAQVAVAAVQKTDLPRYLSGIGTLEAVRQVDVPAEVEGRISKILFTAGAHVRAGQLLVQLNDAPEQGELERLRAQLANAKTLLERTRRLLPQQAATQEQLDQAQASHDQAAAELKRLQALIEQKQIRAPFDGVLGLRRVNLGQFVRAGDPLVSLTDARRLLATITLPEAAVPALQRSQRVSLKVDAYPDRTFEGRLTAIEPQIGSDTRTVRLQADIDNADGALAPGMYANAQVALAPREGALTIPETAITYSTHGSSVFVLRLAEKGQGFVAQQLFVTAGDRQHGLIVIEKGLTANDKVITSGQLRLYNGAAVQPIEKDTLALQERKS